MPRGPGRFSARELARALRATTSLGMSVDRVEIAKDGTIAIMPGRLDQSTAGTTGQCSSDTADKPD